MLLWSNYSVLLKVSNGHFNRAAHLTSYPRPSFFLVLCSAGVQSSSHFISRLAIVNHLTSLVFLKYVAESLLDIINFRFVLEEDGTSVFDEVFAVILQEGAPLGLLKLLQPAEQHVRLTVMLVNKVKLLQIFQVRRMCSVGLNVHVLSLY